MSESVISNDMPQDGREWLCQCARCGSSLDWFQCEVCGGDGTTSPGELYEQDPLWYDPEDFEQCSQCDGEAAYPECMSSSEWCKTNPLPGRESVERHTPEWFCVEPRREAHP